jgi:nitroimidazol reductase NimA-like FMN-containing flavoprotein (pyridoxamine 5'-phosphate oxidase superfamily)
VPGTRLRLRRLPERGRYDRETIDAILDEALFCHVGFVEDGQPFVIPTIHARVGDRLYIHGSSASRMLRRLGHEVRVCVTVTILDGLVLARSAFDHSMNYRSVVVLGTASRVDDPVEKMTALRAIVDHVTPGRWEHIRGPSASELKATSVLRLGLEEASAKVRSGPPNDEEGDLDWPVWAGELPIRLAPQPPRPDPALIPGLALPEHVAKWSAYRLSKSST